MGSGHVLIPEADQGGWLPNFTRDQRGEGGFLRKAGRC